MTEQGSTIAAESERQPRSWQSLLDTIESPSDTYAEVGCASAPKSYQCGLDNAEALGLRRVDRGGPTTLDACSQWVRP
jgi:hypothetical protein